MTTFTELCDLEPALVALEAEIRRFAVERADACEWCADDAWFGAGAYQGLGFKARLAAMVGDFRRPPAGFVDPDPTDLGPGPHTLGEVLQRQTPHVLAVAAALAALPGPDKEREGVLRSSAAYRTAYQHLYPLLPYGPSEGCRCNAGGFGAEEELDAEAFGEVTP